MTERDTYGQNFRRARLDAARRLARDDFEDMGGAARAIGISESYLKRVETGAQRPSFDVLESMARAYNVEIGDLFPSSAPRGPQVDRILGPLATLPGRVREKFVIQMAAFATILAAGIAEATEDGRLSRTAETSEHGVPTRATGLPHPPTLPGVEIANGGQGEEEEYGR